MVSANEAYNHTYGAQIGIWVGDQKLMFCFSSLYRN